MNEQQNFWAKSYAEDYIKKNNVFDQKLGAKCWENMLSNAEGITSILECGCNIGRNIGFLNVILPDASKSIIEISEPAYNYVSSHFNLEKTFNGAIVNSNFTEREFDLVYTMGVLIHIHPDDLLTNMRKMYEYSGKYILIGEYFNRTKVMIEYQGKKDKLFKLDFGKLFINNFDVTLIDYGFLWGHLYDSAGFDDITWWLFEKK